MPNVKDLPKERVLRRYPYLAGMFVFCILAGFIQILVILDCFFPLIEYTPDAVGSVMSTCSEVLAGLYGITLTGYIFLLIDLKIPPKRTKAFMMQYRHY